MNVAQKTFALRSSAFRLKPFPHFHRTFGSSHSSFRQSFHSYGSRTNLVSLSLVTGLLLVSTSTLKPELLPSLPTVEASSPTSYKDPTTSIDFPTTLQGEKEKLVLVGTGVRTVSFLGIRVYTVGWYVGEKAFEDARKGTIKGWKDYTPQRLLPPYPSPSSTSPELSGEALMSSLLSTGTDVAVLIVPLRNTSLPHLRDGFNRALIARLKLSHVTAPFEGPQIEAAMSELNDLKAFFPNRTLAKGNPLLLTLSGRSQTVTFSLPKPNGPGETLGEMKNPILAKELFLSYFSDAAEISFELRKSVAEGFEEGWKGQE